MLAVLSAQGQSKSQQICSIAGLCCKCSSQEIGTAGFILACQLVECAAYVNVEGCSCDLHAAFVSAMISTCACMSQSRKPFK